MKVIKKVLNFIEARRGSKNSLFLLLVLLKDALWVLTYFIPYHIIKFVQSVEHWLIMFICSFLNRYQEKVPVYHKISFCITCMNRLSHLKKTLRRNIKYNLDYPNLEFVLLDYNSADDLQSWTFKKFKKELDQGLLKYYKTEKPKYFHMAKAKNIAHHLATGDIVCNLDADNLTGKDFAFFINSVMQDSLNVIGIHKGGKVNEYFSHHIPGCGGRIFLSKENFLKLGGYNECFIGWGHEDLEFKQRARLLGLSFVAIPKSFLGVIRHSNHVRVKNMPFSIKESFASNMPILEKSYSGNNYEVKNETIDFSEIKLIK